MKPPAPAPRTQKSREPMRTLSPSSVWFVRHLNRFSLTSGRFLPFVNGHHRFSSQQRPCLLQTLLTKLFNFSAGQGVCDLRRFIPTLVKWSKDKQQAECCVLSSPVGFQCIPHHVVTLKIDNKAMVHLHSRKRTWKEFPSCFRSPSKWFNAVPISHLILTHTICLTKWVGEPEAAMARTSNILRSEMTWDGLIWSMYVCVDLDLSVTAPKYEGSCHLLPCQLCCICCPLHPEFFCSTRALLFPQALENPPAEDRGEMIGEMCSSMALAFACRSYLSKSNKI